MLPFHKERAEINVLGELVEKLTEKFDNINIVGTGCNKQKI
jgi:hypothetical protein